MYHNTDDLRIRTQLPLLSPAVVLHELRPTERATEVVTQARKEAARILSGQDDRLLVIVGPCSVHDPKAAMEYAGRLGQEARKHAADLLVVMRVYFEKPRTTVGWKGLINDPEVDGSFKINDGLRLARRLLADIADAGLPAATEFLDPITPQYLADLVAYGAIGARTTESQIHRELASGLSMPVGFKNGTDGSVQVAVDACLSARSSHWFPSVTKDGVVAIFQTSGNPDAHVILRGSSKGPNYGAEGVADAATPPNLIGMSWYSWTRRAGRRPRESGSVSRLLATSRPAATPLARHEPSVQKPPPPGAAHPVDAFIRARLAAANLRPAAAADAP